MDHALISTPNQRLPLDTTTTTHSTGMKKWNALKDYYSRASPTHLAVTSVQEVGRLIRLSVCASAPDKESVECWTGF